MPMCVLYVIPHRVSSQPIEFHMGVTKIPSVGNNIVRGVDFYFLKDRSVDLYSILFPQLIGRYSAYCRDITTFFVTLTPDTLHDLHRPICLHPEEVPTNRNITPSRHAYTMYSALQMYLIEAKLSQYRS